MIKLEILDRDGTVIVSGEWRDQEAKQMSAYRMRWLRYGGRWARSTDGDGRVRTSGDVPEGQGAKPGRYAVYEIQADGSLADEPVKTFKTKTPAVNWQLDHRLGGNPDLAVRWAEDQPEVAEPEAEGFEFGQRVTVKDDRYGRYIGLSGTVVEWPAEIPSDAVPGAIWVRLDDMDSRTPACGFYPHELEAEPYTIDGLPACGADVDGGRCGRAPGREGHPHIPEPQPEPTSPWTRVEDEHPRWELPGDRHPSGALASAGYLVTDEVIRTYGRKHVEGYLLRDLPSLPEEAWEADTRVYVEMNAEPPHPPRTLADYERMAAEREAE
jgi:hypothetical protein